MKKNYQLWVLLGFIGVAIVISFFNIRTEQSQYEVSPESDLTSGINFIETEGPIILEILEPIFYLQAEWYVSSGVKRWIKIIERAKENPKITGIILRINSPGGSVGASQELYEALKRFKESGKPLVTSVIDICASGAYYAALPSDHIVANYGALVGSIGVRITSADFTGLYEKLGIGFTEIKSGEFKDILSPARKLKESERKHLQQIVNFSYEVFLNDVLKWRAKDKAEERKITEAANGLVYDSKQALELGLIDGQGDLIAAKKKMADLLGVPYEKMKIKSLSKNFLENLGQQFPLFQFVNSLFPKAQTLLEYRY